MKGCKRWVVMLLAFGIFYLFSTGIDTNEPPAKKDPAMIEDPAMVSHEDNTPMTAIEPNGTINENDNVSEKAKNMPDNARYNRNLNRLVQSGVIHGNNDNECAPRDHVTRAQFVTALAYAANADLTQYRGVTSFADVSVSAWYAPQIEWAYRQGIMQGREEGRFYPERDITREETVAAIDRYNVSEDCSIFTTISLTTMRTSFYRLMKSIRWKFFWLNC